jgi:hypothetical protein
VKLIDNLGDLDEWVDNIKIELKNGIKVGNWISLTQNKDKWQAVLRKIIRLHVQINAWNFFIK